MAANKQISLTDFSLDEFEQQCKPAACQMSTLHGGASAPLRMPVSRVVHGSILCDPIQHNPSTE